MKHLAFYFKVFMVVSVCVTLSCVRDVPEPRPVTPPQPEIPDPLTVDDAWALFSEYGENFFFYPGMVTRSSFERIGELDWANACNSTLVGYPVVEIPVEEFIASIYREADVPEYLLDVVVSDTLVPNTSVRVVAGLDGWNEPYFRTLYIRPDDSFLETTDKPAQELALDDISENFSGSLHLHYPDGEFALGYVLSEGIVVSILYTSDSEPDNSGGGGEPRTRASENCIIVEYRYLVLMDKYVEDDKVHCVFEWVVDYYADCTTGGGVEEIPNPGGGGSNGGGGSTSQPNPDDYEETVPCEYCGKLPCICKKCPHCKQIESLCKCEICTICQNVKPCNCSECIICDHLPCICVEPTDPCQNMLKKLNEPDFMGKLESLYNMTGLVGTREYAYTYEANPNSGYSFSDLIYGDSNYARIEYNQSTQQSWDGIVHSHYTGAGNMFSFSDLGTIGLAFSGHRGKNPYNFTYGLVTPTGTYFLMINDQRAYGRFYSDYFNKIGGGLTAEGEKKERTFNSMKAYDNMDAFLKFLHDENAGLTLMVHNKRRNTFGQAQYDPTKTFQLIVDCFTSNP